MSKEKQSTRSIDIFRPSPTLITFINEKSLLIYFRGNSYVYGGMHSSKEAFCLVDPYFDVPYSKLPKGKDIYEENDEKLFRLRKGSPLTVSQHIDRYGYIIKEKMNFALYSSIDEFVLLSGLCFTCKPHIKVERMIHENQFLLFSKFLDKMGDVRVCIGDSIMDVDYWEKGEFEVLSMGYAAEESPVVNDVITLNTSSFLNDIIEGCHEYYKNLLGKGSTSLYPTLPYSISYTNSYFTLRDDKEHDIIVSEPYCTCPFKKDEIIDGFLDDKGLLHMFINDNLHGTRIPFFLSVKKCFNDTPKRTSLSVCTGLDGCIIFKIKDDDKNEILEEFYIGDLLNDAFFDESVTTKSFFK